MVSRTLGRRCIPIVVLTLLLGSDPSRTQERSAPRVRSGLVETTGVSLMLVDVEVTDEQGNPIHGLTRDDFTVLLDGRERSVYSVDDLCSCSASAEAATLLTAEEAASVALDRELVVPTERPPAIPAFQDPIHFILYLDYSQLQQDGRVRAGEEARRWIRETMRPGDPVMLAAYASDAGLVVLREFTSDKAALLAALDAAERRVDLNDPFPTLLSNRQDECERCCRTACDCQACRWIMAQKEYVHSKHAFEALERLFEMLEPVPGRKSLILFHQNGTLFPARYYGTDRVGDHNLLLDRLASEATLARTAIYPAYSGDGNDLAVNLGANLADYTGGGYNRGPSDLAALVREAGRRCACIYRLGLVPPGGPRERPYRVTVYVGDRALPHRYRVVNLSDSERWMRSARAVLAAPARARDVALAAAVIPLTADKRGWDVSVQVTFDAEALLQLPRQAQSAGSWEVGALLTDERGRKSWEMLGVSEFKRTGEGKNPSAIRHERRIAGLRPGTYELRAFVRDRWANVYGGARAEIVLPRLRGPAVVGPVVTRGHSAVVRTTLPLLDKAGRTTEPSRAGSIEQVALPLGDRAVRPGEALEFWSWICPGDAALAISGVARHVASEDKPLFRFEAPFVSAAGDCTALVDRLDSTPMAAGHYTYQLEWDRDGAGDALQAETDFTVGSRASVASSYPEVP